MVVKIDQDNIVKEYFYKTYTTNIEFDEYTKKDLNKLKEYIKTKYNSYDDYGFDEYIFDNNDDKLYDILRFDFNLFDYIDKDTYYSNTNIKYFYQKYNEAYIKDNHYTLSNIFGTYIFDYIEDFYDELHIFKKFKKLNDYLDENYKIYLDEYKYLDSESDNDNDSESDNDNDNDSENDNDNESNNDNDSESNNDNDSESNNDNDSDDD